jgi:hypothetical protein
MYLDVYLHIVTNLHIYIHIGLGVPPPANEPHGKFEIQTTKPMKVGKICIYIYIYIHIYVYIYILPLVRINMPRYNF